MCGNEAARGVADGAPREAGPSDEAATVADLLSQLRAMLSSLPSEGPDGLDGAEWVHVESALRDLHGALAALEIDGVPA
jgi:hypothetical protein